MTTPAPVAELKQAILSIVEAAVEQDDITVALDLYLKVWAIHGDRGMYVVSRGLAAIIKTWLDSDDVPKDGVWGLEFEDARTGEIVQPEEVVERMRGTVLATRFLAASFNNDNDTADALFRSIDEPETGTLLKGVREAGRRKLVECSCPNHEHEHDHGDDH